ncbi:MAG TPA: RNA polymerase sigma factor, partial [Streptomyces sp.]|nr:RNA polymerase sigma factor [Streptomyces sp.]
MGAEDDRPPGLSEADDAQSSDARRRLLLSFDAFDASHHRLWLRYAHTQVGSRAAAQRVVEDACRHLLDHWVHALRRQSLTEYAWTVLKEHVARWLSEHRQRPQLAETAAFHAAIRKALLFELRDEFAVLEGEIGLYAAITRL